MKLDLTSARLNSVLKPCTWFGLTCCSYNSPCGTIHNCLVSTVMNTKEDARISSLIDTPNSPSTSDTGEVTNTLPYRSPSHLQQKLLAGCMPLHGLRRTVSSPRHAYHRATTTLATTLSSYVTSVKDSDPASASGIKEPPPAGSVTNMTSDSWGHEGSFRWRRVRPSATIHHTSPSTLKPFCLRSKHPHSSLSESSDTTISIGLTTPPTTPLTEPGSGFRDPMLEELDAELPVPPPPPRAYPAWLKLALRKKREQASAPSSISVDYSNLPSDGNSTQPKDSCYPSLEQRSLEHSRYGTRIYPVMQNGVKISDTHYWLLDAPHSLNSRLRCPGPENECIPSCHLHTAGEYLNVPAGFQLRRGKSQSSPQALNNIHDQMVRRLMEQVPEATRPECQAVLIGTSYRYEEAVKRLKLELLCRLGYLSQSHCKRVLQKTEWDLQRATEEARLVYQTRESLQKGHNKPDNRLHITENLSPSLCDSSSTNVFRPPSMLASSESSSSPGSINTTQTSVFLYKSSLPTNDNTNPFLNPQPP